MKRILEQSQGMPWKMEKKCFTSCDKGKKQEKLQSEIGRIANLAGKLTYIKVFDVNYLGEQSALDI